MSLWRLKSSWFCVCSKELLTSSQSGDFIQKQRLCVECAWWENVVLSTVFAIWIFSPRIRNVWPIRRTLFIRQRMLDFFYQKSFLNPFTITPPSNWQFTIAQTVKYNQVLSFLKRHHSAIHLFTTSNEVQLLQSDRVELDQHQNMNALKKKLKGNVLDGDGATTGHLVSCILKDCPLFISFTILSYPPPTTIDSLSTTTTADPLNHNYSELILECGTWIKYRIKVADMSVKPSWTYKVSIEKEARPLAFIQSHPSNKSFNKSYHESWMFMSLQTRR